MDRYRSIENIYQLHPVTKRADKSLFRNPVVQSLANADWLFTEKVDGMNMRVILHPNGIIDIRGRGDNAQIPLDLLTRMQYLFCSPTTVLQPSIHWQKQFDWWWELPEDARPTICLYGEGYGPGIQKCGGNYGTRKDFILFDVKVGDNFLDYEGVAQVAFGLGCDVVPVIGVGPLGKAVAMVTRGWVSRLTGKLRCEGIVARLPHELVDRRGNRMLVKIKDRDLYLETGQMELPQVTGA